MKISRLYRKYNNLKRDKKISSERLNKLAIKINNKLNRKVRNLIKISVGKTSGELWISTL